MKRLVLGLALLVLVGGCSSGDPWNPGYPDISRTNLYLANFSSEAVYGVHVRPAGTPEWGENWLSGPISGGNLYGFVGNVLSGRYDIRMVGQVHTVETLDFNCVGSALAVSFNP